MEYQGFVVDAFQLDPGKWRAAISRSSGQPVITGRKRIWRFVTGVDATTASGGVAHGPYGSHRRARFLAPAVARKILAP